MITRSRKFLIPILAAAAMTISHSASAGFLPGDLVVVEGTNDGANINDAAQLQEYTVAGSSVGSALPLAMPTGLPLVLPGTLSASHEGQLTLSADGNVLTMAAYEDSASPSDGLPADTDTSANAPRVVVVVSPSGALDTSTVLAGTSDYNTVAIRQVTSIDGTQFWTSGNGLKPYGTAPDVGGLRYTTVGASTTTSLNAAGGLDIRTTTIFDGQLYGATGSSNNPLASLGGSGHFAAMLGSGLPTSGAIGWTGLSATTGSPAVVSGNQSLNFDVLSDGTTVLYLSDSSEGSPTGALDKWVLQTSGQWAKEGTILLPGLEDLATSVNGTTVDVYASTAAGIYHLADSSDTGSIAGDSFSQIISVPSGDAFYGLAFAPVAAPEPAGMSLLIVGATALLRRRR